MQVVLSFVKYLVGGLAFVASVVTILGYLGIDASTASGYVGGFLGMLRDGWTGLLGVVNITSPKFQVIASWITVILAASLEVLTISRKRNRNT